MFALLDSFLNTHAPHVKNKNKTVSEKIRNAFIACKKLLHGRRCKSGSKTSAHCPSVLAEVLAYPTQVAATICVSFLPAAQRSARAERNYLHCYNNITLQHGPDNTMLKLCQLALSYVISRCIKPH